MSERIIHGLCRGKQSAWLSANRTKAGVPAAPTTKFITLRRTKCENETFLSPFA